VVCADVGIVTWFIYDKVVAAVHSMYISRLAIPLSPQQLAQISLSLHSDKEPMPAS
jgi:hypothetical protein